MTTIATMAQYAQVSPQPSVRMDRLELDTAAESSEAILARLQRDVPFLRGMVSNLSSDCAQHKKITALCDIIDKKKKVRYDTLQKCARVVDLLRSKRQLNHVNAVRPALAMQPPPASPIVVEDASPTSLIVVEDSSPAPSNASTEEWTVGLRSPSPTSQFFGDDSGELYVDDRPSIYEAARDSVTAVVQAQPQQPILPPIDTSLPPISAADLQELLHTDDDATDPAHKKEGDVEEMPCKPSQAAVSFSIGCSSKSKVSLVPAPFHKKRKDERPSKSSNETKSSRSEHDRRRSSSSSRGSSSKKHSKDSKSKPKKIVNDEHSVFGSLLTSLDEQLLGDGATVGERKRRDSKDGADATAGKYDAKSTNKQKRNGLCDKRHQRSKEFQTLKKCVSDFKDSRKSKLTDADRFLIKEKSDTIKVAVDEVHSDKVKKKEEHKERHRSKHAPDGKSDKARHSRDAHHSRERRRKDSRESRCSRDSADPHKDRKHSEKVPKHKNEVINHKDEDSKTKYTKIKTEKSPAKDETVAHSKDKPRAVQFKIKKKPSTILPVVIKSLKSSDEDDEVDYLAARKKILDELEQLESEPPPADASEVPPDEEITKSAIAKPPTKGTVGFVRDKPLSVQFKIKKKSAVVTSEAEKSEPPVKDLMGFVTRQPLQPPPIPPQLPDILLQSGASPKPVLPVTFDPFADIIPDMGRFSPPPPFEGENAVASFSPPDAVPTPPAPRPVQRVIKDPRLRGKPQGPLASLAQHHHSEQYVSNLNTTVALPDLGFKPLPSAPGSVRVRPLLPTKPHIPVPHIPCMPAMRPMAALLKAPLPNAHLFEDRSAEQFHPFDPIGNAQTDTSRQAYDHHNRNALVARTYKQWRQQQMREQEMLRKQEESAWIKNIPTPQSESPDVQIIEAKSSTEPTMVPDNISNDVVEERDDYNATPSDTDWSRDHDDENNDPNWTDFTVDANSSQQKDCDPIWALHQSPEKTQLEQNTESEPYPELVISIDDEDTQSKGSCDMNLDSEDEGQEISITCDKPSESADPPLVNSGDEIDPNKLLEILGQAKMNQNSDGRTFLSTRVLEMVETFLQKQRAAATATENKTPVVEKEEEEVLTTPQEEEELEAPVAENTTISSVEDSVSLPSTTNKADESVSQEEDEDLEIPIGRRLRRRKSINYQDTTRHRAPSKESNKETVISPKRGRKKTPVPAQELAESSVSLNDLNKMIDAVSDGAKNTPVRQTPRRVASAKEDIKVQENLDTPPILTPQKVTLSKKIPTKRSGTPFSVTLTKLMDENASDRRSQRNSARLAASKISADAAVEARMDRLEKQAASASKPEVPADDVKADRQPKEEKPIVIKLETEFVDVEMLDDCKQASPASCLKDDNEEAPPPPLQDGDGQTRKRKPMPRKSELEILHQDIKDTMGERVLQSKRISALPASLAIYREFRNLRLPPATEEMLELGRTLRVLVEHIPDDQEMVDGVRVLRPAVTAATPKKKRAVRVLRVDKLNLDVELSSSEGGRKRKNSTSTDDNAAPKKVKRATEERDESMPILRMNIIPDKGYYLKAERPGNRCLLCDFTGGSITAHYVQTHPFSEVLISRLSPDATQEAYSESVTNDYANLDAVDLVCGKAPAKFSFRCRFCAHDLQNEPTAAFYDHVSTHTGEARFRCTQCLFKHHTKSVIKNHMTFEHHTPAEPRVDAPPPNFDKLFGYICSECNFLQLRKAAVEKHINDFHTNEQAYVYIISMSLPILPERKGASARIQPKPKAVKRTTLVQETNVQKKKAEANSAFVCSEWDEEIRTKKTAKAAAAQTAPTITKRKSFIDELKERFDPGGYLAPKDVEVSFSQEERPSTPLAPKAYNKTLSEEKEEVEIKEEKVDVDDMPLEDENDYLELPAEAMLEMKTENEVEEPQPPPPPAETPMVFTIAKVESLAAKSPPALAPISPVKPTTEAQPGSPAAPIVSYIVPMTREEAKKERKSPTVFADWLAKGKTGLFKCPQFNCDYITSSEVHFDEHFKMHRFDTLLPCLYCNFKISRDCYKIHVVTRHGACEYSCGYCLYRGLQDKYVQIHHCEEHSDLTLKIVVNEKAVLAKRYNNPALPSIESILKKFLCVCKAAYFCANNFRHHITMCPVYASNPRKEEPAVHNCRYCDYAAVSRMVVANHIVIQHPSQIIAIIQRLSGKQPTKKEDADVWQRFKILGDVSRSLNLINYIQPAQVSPQVKKTATGNLPPTGSKLMHLIVPNLPNNADPAQQQQQQQRIMRIMLLNQNGGAASGGQVVSNLMLVPSSSLTPLATTSTATSVTPAAANVVGSGIKVMNSAQINSLSAAASPAPRSPLASSTSEPTFADLVENIQPYNPAPSEIVDVKDLYRCSQCRTLFDEPPKFLDHLHSCKNEAVTHRPYACFHCRRGFKYPVPLMVHMRTHSVNNLTCGLCDHREASVAQLKRHFKVMHKLTSFTLHPVDPTKTNLESDFFIAKPTTSPTIPTATTTTASEEMVDGDDTVFVPADIGRLPMRSIFKFIANCKICSYASKVRSNFVRHLSMHSTGKIDAPIVEAVNPVPCLENKELMFDKMTNLAASSHEGGRMRVSAPDPKIKTEVSETEVKSPTFEFIPEHRRYVCGATGCNYLCLEEQILRHHVQALHDSERNYACPHCGENLNPTRTFIDLDAIFNHLHLHEASLYKCGHCEYMNNKAANVERHCAAKHTGRPHLVENLRSNAMEQQPVDDVVDTPKKKAWRCSLCACRKATEEEIRVHAQDKHTLAALYKCTYCKFLNDSEDAVREHFTAQHPMLKLDYIVAYYKEKESETAVEEPEASTSFDTTPLWKLNKSNNVKHIRGILVDEEVAELKKPVKAGKSPGKVATGRRRLSAKSDATPPAVKQPKLEPAPTVKVAVKVESPEADVRIIENTPAIIELADEVVDDPFATPATEDVRNPSLVRITMLTINALLTHNFADPKYGAYGLPTGTTFQCPHCARDDIADSDVFRQHLYEEISYDRYACALCGTRTTTFSAMNAHYTAKHLVLCETDSVKQLEVVPEMEQWVRKVLTLQHRIIEHNLKKASGSVTEAVAAADGGGGDGGAEVERKKPTRSGPFQKKSFRCGYCQHTTSTRNELVAHSCAAHPDKGVKIQHLVLVRTPKPKPVT